MQIFERGPGDREPVEGRGAAPDLVQHHEGARARLIEDGGGLDHLDHEGRAAAGEIVGRADAAEQTVDDAERGTLRRHERAGLGEHDDERVLAEEGRLARHVGSGHDEDARGVAAVAELAVVADEACAVAAPQILLDHRVAPLLDGEDETSVDLGADIALLDRQLGEAGIVIELGKRRARRGKRLLLGKHVVAEPREIFELERKRAVRRLDDARLELGKLARREAHDIGKGLAVDESLGDAAASTACRRWSR